MNYEKEAIKFMSYFAKIRRSPNERVQRFSKGEFCTLRNLQELGGVAIGSELAEKENITPSRMSAILDSLEKKGYVTREADAADRRRIRILFTEKGKCLVEELHQEALQDTIRYFEYLGEEDTAHLLHIMEKSVEYSSQRYEENARKESRKPK